MAADEFERTGVLLIRVWIEEGQDELRCRIAESKELASGAQTTVAASSVGEICEIVRTWLDAFVDGDRSFEP